MHTIVDIHSWWAEPTLQLFTIMTNIDTLLSPISGSSPCGEDCLFSADFDAIAQARTFDDPTLDQGEWEVDLKEANWPFVIERCTALLSEKTKDIRLAVWLTEALALKKGFAGLAQGYTLVADLCDRYWTHLHPQPEDEDIEQRIGNLGWLLSRSLQLVKEIPLTNSAQGNYNALQWETANNLVQAIKRAPNDADELSRGKVSMADFDAARKASSREFYTALLTDVNASAAALARLEKVLDSKLGGEDGPSFSPAKNALETIRSLVEHFHREAGGKPATSTSKPANPTTDSKISTLQHTSAAGENMAIPIAGELKNRAQALAQLRQVAAFFRRTEPHSPVAYLAEKAAKAGEVPLHVWLRSVIKDDASFAHIGEMLGFEVPDVENE
jgi:type VI secretion system protein ImpA